MKHLDAGCSGQNVPAQCVGLEAPDLSAPWSAVIDLLIAGNPLRPVQIAALKTYNILGSRRNLIVAAPTNSGKSLVGTLVLLDAVRRGRRAVLLEPLRALAQEKADELNELAPQLAQALEKPFSVTITTGDYRLRDETFAAPPPQHGELIIATPERLDALLRHPDHDGWIATIDAICVDEAHLISSPHRGPTLEQVITSFLCRPAPPRIALLSASLGDTTQAEAWLQPCDVIRVSERTPALFKNVLVLDDGEDVDAVVGALVQPILDKPETNLLIFVYQTRSAERLAGWLNEQICSSTEEDCVQAYHGQMSLAQRREVEHAFRTGQCRCLVTTTALALGVNLPATHVIVRDNTFPGVGRLDTGELLQMMGRAGRGNTEGHATVLVRPSDGWVGAELAQALRVEQLPDLVSAHMLRSSSYGPRDADGNTNTEAVAAQVATLLSRRHEAGMSASELQQFCQRSLGGQQLAAYIDKALPWLTEPLRVLAYVDQHDRYRLTVLGLKATRAVLPLDIACGTAQLLRDLMTIDSTDSLLTDWQPLDHLILLNLLYTRTPKLRRFSAELAEQVDAWMERTSTQRNSASSLLFRHWIRGRPGHSKADEVLGSLGIASLQRQRDPSESARKTAYLATLNAILLYERSQGISVPELARQWRVRGLDGIEERWRDDMLWLLSGLTQILDLRCFFYHLKEECKADPARLKTIKQRLRHMVRQIFILQEQLKYCSPLGSLLYSIRRTHPTSERRIGIGSIRTLEAAGITNLSQLHHVSIQELMTLGLRKEFAQQVYYYMQRRLQ